MKHWVIFGTVYTIVYVVLAIAAINPEGTGTGVFLVPMITWIFLLAALYLSNRLDDVRNRIFFCLAMLTHYIVSLLFISVLFTEPHDTSGGFWRMRERQRGLILLTAGWYVLGPGVHLGHGFTKAR